MTARDDVSTYKTSSGTAPIPSFGDLLAIPQGPGSKDIQLGIVVQSKLNSDPNMAPSLYVMLGKPYDGGSTGPGQFVTPVMGKLVLFDANLPMPVPCKESILPQAIQEARYMLGADLRSQNVMVGTKPPLRAAVSLDTVKNAHREAADVKRVEHVNEALPSMAHVDTVIAAARRAPPGMALGMVLGRAPPRPDPSLSESHEPRRPRMR